MCCVRIRILIWQSNMLCIHVHYVVDTYCNFKITNKTYKIILVLLSIGKPGIRISSMKAVFLRMLGGSIHERLLLDFVSSDGVRHESKPITCA